MFNKKTVKDINLSGKRIVYRPDWNVPADDEGNVTDDFRIRAVKETFDYMLAQEPEQIVILSHRGRPKDNEQKLSLKKVAQKATEILGQEITFNDTYLSGGDKPTGKLVLLENVRFYEGEKANEPSFIEKLAELGDVFVSDCFAVAHRDTSSVTGVAKKLPAVAGFLLANELEQLHSAIENPEQPVLAITGGAKLETKLPLLEKFIELADQVVVAGVMANTLLVAKGFEVGKSIYEESELETAKKVLEKANNMGVTLFLPTADVMTGKSLDSKDSKVCSFVEGEKVEQDELILDFGPNSLAEVLSFVKSAKTIIWNGPLGYYENPLFAKGSQAVAKAIAESGAKSIVGGGDTADVVNELGLTNSFTHVSTGGGASLEVLAGNKLPGVEVLLDK